MAFPSSLQVTNPHKAVDIIGVKVHDVTFPEALDLLQQYIQSRRPHLVVTPNPEFVIRAQRDIGFRQIINSAALSIPDGVGLVIASRMLGDPIRQHVRGTDLVEKLAGIAAVEGYRFFLLGAAEGVAEIAAAKLQEKYPGLQIAGTHSGSPKASYDERALAAIRAAGHVDVLLVAYGAPAQEHWIVRNQARLGIPLAIGVGGVLDFFSGRAKRAPHWVRRIEMEWLYRLVQQPSRWRRQLALPNFALRVLIAWLGRRLIHQERASV